MNETIKQVSSTLIGADRAALSIWNVGVFTMGRVVADHLVAQDGPHVAHADLAGFWFPYILVVVRLFF